MRFAPWWVTVGLFLLGVALQTLLGGRYGIVLIVFSAAILIYRGYRVMRRE